ncbi:MAG: rhodanese-like domain-containing protein [Deltaproteobacteria bacterium]|nr:MAG: rhodanese-like domain-containing protein [Deltaproteobacteria bacterium]
MNVRFFLLVLGLFVLPGFVEAAVVQNVNAQTARQLLAQKPNLFLLDVRTPEEYFQVRLEGAVLIPLDQLSRRLADIPRDRPVLVYCAVGSRSSQAAGYLARLGYPEVYNLYGGIWGWQLRGYPVLKGAP